MNDKQTNLSRSTTSIPGNRGNRHVQFQNDCSPSLPKAPKKENRNAMSYSEMMNLGYVDPRTCYQIKKCPDTELKKMYDGNFKPVVGTKNRADKFFQKFENVRPSKINTNENHN